MATKSKALMKREETGLHFPDLHKLDSHFQVGLVDIATRLSDRNITPESLTEVTDLINRNEKAIKKMGELAKKHLKAMALEHGTKSTETTQIVATFGEYRVELRAQNTKLDDKKVQAMLSEKGMSLEAGMDKDISYVVNESKLQDLIARKKISKDEVEACRHELKYNLQSPKKIGDPENVGDE